MGMDLDNLPEDVEALRAALRLVHSQNAEIAARNAELETINQTWGRGFERGVELRQASWLRLWSALEEATDLLDLARNDLDESLREEILWFAGSTPRDIAAFWMEQQKPSVPFKTAKVGRKEQCPRGSGKKWKKCFGAAAGALH
jgi:uncharacterized protein